VSDVRAILVSDLHLQPRPTVARSAEPDWYAAMQRPLDEIRALGNRFGVPIIYAGDIFDRWNAPPEVINFALQNLAPGYAVPGQHDLPNHRYEGIERSAYWTLVAAGVLTDIPAGGRRIAVASSGLETIAWGFPWGHQVEPPDPDPGVDSPGSLRLAVVHAFIWTKSTGYMDADEGKKVAGYKSALQGFDAAVFGDNHKGFIVHPRGGPAICNCGGMMRRRIDEVGYRPGCGLLLGDGRVVRYYFDTSDDKFIDFSAAEEALELALDMGGLVGELAALGAGDALNFVDALRRFLRDNKIDARVRDIIEGDA